MLSFPKNLTGLLHFFFKTLWISSSMGTKRGKMNCFYGCQQMNTVTSCEEIRMESVVCSKPRRLGLSNNSSMNNNHIRPLSYQSEMEDSGVGAELLDIILSKEPGRAEDKVLASSPPVFCGSPPSRASNPVIQDEQFGNGNFSPVTYMWRPVSRPVAHVTYMWRPTLLQNITNELGITALHIKLRATGGNKTKITDVSRGHTLRNLFGGAVNLQVRKTGGEKWKSMTKAISNSIFDT